MTALQTAQVTQMISMRTGLKRCLGLETEGRRFILGPHLTVPAAKICRDYVVLIDSSIKTKFSDFDV